MVVLGDWTRNLLEKYEGCLETLAEGRSNDADELVGYYEAEIKHLNATHNQVMK